MENPKKTCRLASIGCSLTLSLCLGFSSFFARFCRFSSFLKVFVVFRPFPRDSVVFRPSPILLPLILESGDGGKRGHLEKRMLLQIGKKLLECDFTRRPYKCHRQGWLHVRYPSFKCMWIRGDHSATYRWYCMAMCTMRVARHLCWFCLFPASRLLFLPQRWTQHMGGNRRGFEFSS